MSPRGLDEAVRPRKQHEPGQGAWESVQGGLPLQRRLPPGRGHQTVLIPRAMRPVHKDALVLQRKLSFVSSD